MFNREKMKNYFVEKGIKQKFVAQKAGIPERALSSILSGKRNCDIDEYTKICISLDVPFTLFLDLTPQQSA